MSLISIITAIYDPVPEFLMAAYKSVRTQVVPAGNSGNAPSISVRMRRAHESSVSGMQDATRPTATRHGVRSAEEIGIACDPHIRVLDAALELGRMTKAAQSARRRFLDSESSRCQRQILAPQLPLPDTNGCESARTPVDDRGQRGGRPVPRGPLSIDRRPLRRGRSSGLIAFPFQRLISSQMLVAEDARGRRL